MDYLHLLFNPLSQTRRPGDKDSWAPPRMIIRHALDAHRAQTKRAEQLYSTSSYDKTLED